MLPTPSEYLELEIDTLPSIYEIDTKKEIEKCD